MKRIYAIILCLLILIALLMVKIKLLPTVLNNQNEVQQTEKLQKENTLKKKEKKKREAKNIENEKDKKAKPKETKQPTIEKKNNKDNEQAKPVAQEKKNSVNNTQSNHVKKENIEPTKPAKKEIVKTKKSYTKEISLPFKTETEYDDTLEYGVQKTIQEGQQGYIVHRITEHYQNNQFISKEEEIIDRKEPINKKVLIGTKKIEKPASNPSSGLERQVFDLVNAARKSHGLGGLTWNSALAEAAHIRAQEIAVNFSHTRPSGEAWHTIAPHIARGENIAYGQSSAQHVHSSWMNSEGHRANILNHNFKSIGIGLYIDNNGRKHWVQLFG